MCRNSYSYRGLKNKLEFFPVGVFIIGSQTQTDTRKDKLNNRSPFLSKFPYNQPAILELAFQDSFGQANDKNKETLKTAKHLTKLLPNKVTIQTPQFLSRHGLECTDVETAVCVKDRILTNECVDKIVGYALSHQFKHCTIPTSRKDVLLALSGERLKHGVDLWESMQSDPKKKSTKKSLKLISTRSDKLKANSCTSIIDVLSIHSVKLYYLDVRSIYVNVVLLGCQIYVGTQKCNSGPSVYNALVQDHASAHSDNISEISIPYTKMTNK